MHFTNKKLRALGYSERGVQHLRSRQRGASAATGGFHYQRCFAVLRLLELAASHQDGRVFLDALCPVDDVVVESGGHHEHSQVKESATATWGRNGGQLRREFLAQWRLMRRARLDDYVLQVVTPHGHRASHFQHRAPTALKPVLSVRWFRRPRSPHRPWSVPDVERALDRLLLDPISGPAERERLWTAMNHACGTPWRGVRACTLLRDACRFDRDLPARDAKRRSGTASRQVRKALSILNSIPRLDVQIVDGICFFDFEGVERRFIARIDDPRFTRFVLRIISRKPADIRAVYEELP